MLDLLQRSTSLFELDLEQHENEIIRIVNNSRFLVLGGAGTIGQAVTKEIFKRQPHKLHVVDISENNLVELVRDLRSSLGYIQGDFQTFTLDIGSIEYDAFFMADGGYDYVLNLSALKHVRNEKDPFTLMRMVRTNILNTEKTLQQSIHCGAKKYFCVSTDKAANPANMMGASKKIMEMFVARASEQIDVSMARFANVAFSDGSLLHSFKQRIEKNQPIVAPNDIKRYFVTPEESGLICLFSCLLGKNEDIFFPKLNDELHLLTFSSIAKRYLKLKGFGVHTCNTEEEARHLVSSLPSQGRWPCLFTQSDTTGEKDIEEFYTENEKLDMQCFDGLGVIKDSLEFNEQKLDKFINQVDTLLVKQSWTKEQILLLFYMLLPEFAHQETGKYLEGKM
ncbi:UDP-N-acetylglucosamine 4,6-dehydratase [Pseudoalteromonas shioyasakiensis]|uniref:UDP-N-acetylglucosamine 4,6-dehydratase n=1 Tax=Pseudoalteromonas shioyasakiensis TaxID=1190813 RepID=UPI002117A2BD|nr:UDP-N-acetylglucosamine 4,6-dehydratase [Pseudoalteromonas shioyasakiensis]MCQ8877376.1 UDP-N-acetylglucosamine 4,6-dehydratase [Pseudoalteromonas shioyasakiensis]